MLAFSGCDYGGGEKERIELGAMRKRWKTLHVRFLFHEYNIVLSVISEIPYLLGNIL